MTSKVHIEKKRERSRVRATEDELVVSTPTTGSRKPTTVAFQWHDGAGELHYEVLSPAQSWPYLCKN